MKPETRNAVWYSFGVFASLAAVFSSPGESERIQPSDPLAFLLAGVWSAAMGCLFLAYGTVSRRWRPFDMTGISHFLPLLAGLAYVPLLFGGIRLLALLCQDATGRIDEGFWGFGLVILLGSPVCSFELNRIRRGKRTASGTTGRPKNPEPA